MRDGPVAVKESDGGGVTPPAVRYFKDFEGRRRVRRIPFLLVLFVAFSVSTGFRDVLQAGEAAVKAPADQAVSEQQSQPERKATLAIKPGEKNSYGIDLENSVPVRGIQFTVVGLKMTEVRTSSRTPGFLAKFNEETGIVILVSTVADEIAPGKGPVLTLMGEKVPDAEVSLSKVMIADTERKLIE